MDDKLVDLDGTLKSHPHIRSIWRIVCDNGIELRIALPSVWGLDTPHEGQRVHVVAREKITISYDVVEILPDRYDPPDESDDDPDDDGDDDPEPKGPASHPRHVKV